MTHDHAFTGGKWVSAAHSLRQVFVAVVFCYGARGIQHEILVYAVVCEYIYTYVYICKYIEGIYTDDYTYMHMHIYTYIHIYIYIYIYNINIHI